MTMTATSPTREIIPPTPSPETAPFWEAAGKGQLLIRRCNTCHQAHYYPRTYCPHCLSDNTDWQTCEGRGRIHSFSVMRRVPVPYAVAYVELEEGPTMLCNLVKCDFDRLAIGQSVELRFISFEGGQLPAFSPAG
jgi:uncharacterized protein